MNDNQPLDQHLQADETKKSVLKWKVIQAEENIRFAQGTIYFLVIVTFFSIFRSWGTLEDVDLYFEIGLLSIYLICAVVAYKYPVIGLAVALGVFLLIQVLIYTIAPSLFFQGMILRGVMLMGLSIGLYNAIKGYRIKKELDSYEL